MKSKLDSFIETAPVSTRYILAATFALAAVGLRLAILPVSIGAKFTTFYPAVILAFYMCGNGPGILAIAITFISADYLLLPPFGSFRLTDESIYQAVLYLIATGTCGYFVHRMHSYRREAILAKESFLQERLNASSQSLSLAIEGGRLGTWEFRPADRFVLFSDRFAEQFGLPFGVRAVSYEKVLDIVHPDDRAEVDKSLLRAIDQKADFVVDHRVILPDGSQRWIYGVGRPSFCLDGSLNRIDGITVDDTLRKLAEKEKFELLSAFKAAFDCMTEAIVIGDANGNLTATNQAASSFFRIRDTDHPFKTISDFGELYEISTLDDQPITHPYNLALQGITRTYEVKIRRKDTGETWFALTGTGPIRNEEGKIIGAASSAQDITGLIELKADLERRVEQRTAELTEANRLLNEMSHHDALTGLYNRLACDEKLLAEFERMKRTGQVYSILMIDIDFFKRVNDNFGHATGDEILKSISECLSLNLREYDFIGRWGGEEFVVLLPATEIRVAFIVAEKLRLAVEGLMHKDVGVVTISVGAATASSRDSEQNDAVIEADESLYQAKAQGRNCVASKSFPIVGETRLSSCV